ncbi:MAG: urate hydroxylase PuuD, partial [Flavobacteriales bacterium]|nr:urate hydroxylase PuuD [Flavobacteriales bacterium]
MRSFFKYAYLLIMVLWSVMVPAQDTLKAAQENVAFPAAVGVDMESEAEQLPAPDLSGKLIAGPYNAIAAVVMGLLLFLFIWFRNLAERLNEKLGDLGLSEGVRFDLEDARSTTIAARQATKFFGLLVLGGYLTYVAVVGTPMYGYVMEWLNLAVRWTHVIAGIMWIGASFYFIFLENNLNRTEGLRDELAGNLWAIHGGGFYYLEKYKVAPKVIPAHLHWFKYEAYFTWLSGFALLFLVYYADAKAFMIDPTVADIATPTAIAIGVGSLVLGYVIYDVMCRSKLILDQGRFALVGTVILAVICY